MKREIELDSLFEAARRGIISEEQAQHLWDMLEESPMTTMENAQDTPLSKLLYYFGALIVISAMGWMTNKTWEQFGGLGLFLIAMVNAIGFIAAGRYFKDKSVSLSGLLIIMAVGMTPLGTFGLQKWLGLWPELNHDYYKNFYLYVKSGWFTMEVATLLAGVAALRLVRLPFVTAPIAFILWFMSMDVTPILFGTDYSWEMRKLVSLVFGLVMMCMALVTDRRTMVDYAKWLYMFGVLLFWGAITLLLPHSELSRFFYGLLNVFLMMAGVLLARNVFMVVGALGSFGYMGHLAWSVFQNSLMFPFVLAAVGLAFMGTGWAYHRKREKIEASLYAMTPKWVCTFLRLR